MHFSMPWGFGGMALLLGAKKFQFGFPSFYNAFKSIFSIDDAPNKTSILKGVFFGLFLLFRNF